MEVLPGVHPSPNIQSAPVIYEIENTGADSEGIFWPLWLKFWEYARMESTWCTARIPTRSRRHRARGNFVRLLRRPLAGADD